MTSPPGMRPQPLRVPSFPPRLMSFLVGGASLLLAGCMVPRWPVEAELTSPYGLRWRGLGLELHRGVDLDVPSGTEVRAMARGRVRFAGTMRGYGEVVWLDHPGGVLSVYAHLSDIRVRGGEEVRGGQVIGVSGSSGDVSGPHLHFEVWRHGREVDPVPLLGGFPGGKRKGRSPRMETGLARQEGWPGNAVLPYPPSEAPR